MPARRQDSSDIAGLTTEARLRELADAIGQLHECVGCLRTQRKTVTKCA
jgi:hypothetical protein